MKHSASFVVLTCMAVLFCGCDWWLGITQVTGTVTVDGRPVGGAQVVFEPLTPGRPRAVAVTGRDGGYHLSRQGPGARGGAAAGRYRVKILTDTEGSNAPPIPAAYNSRSALEFDVLPGKPNVFDVDVKTKP